MELNHDLTRERAIFDLCIPRVWPSAPFFKLNEKRKKEKLIN